VARRFDPERSLFPVTVRAGGTSVRSRTGAHSQFLATLFEVAGEGTGHALFERVEATRGNWWHGVPLRLSNRTNHFKA
jgi:hypothetical protein